MSLLAAKPVAAWLPSPSRLGGRPGMAGDAAKVAPQLPLVPRMPCIAPLKQLSRSMGHPTVCQSRRQQRGDNRQTRRRQPDSDRQSLTQYALPAVGLLAIATLTGPLLGAVMLSAMGLAAAFSAVGVALSISWVAIPFLVGIFGLPALVFGGLAAGAFATAGIVQLALISAGLFFGARLARMLFFGGSSNDDEDEGGSIDPRNATIDVEVESDDWKDQLLRERERRERELREFDELLRKREEFTRGRGPGA